MEEAGATRHNFEDCNVNALQPEQTVLNVPQPASSSVNRKRGVARLPRGNQTRRRGKAKRAEKRPDMLAVEPVMLTRQQAAELAQVSLSKLDKWSREPGCPVLREGGHFVRFHRDEFIIWLAQRTRQQQN